MPGFYKQRRANMSPLVVKGASDFKCWWEIMPPCCIVSILAMIVIDKHSRHVPPRTLNVSQALCDYFKSYPENNFVLGHKKELELDALKSHLCIWCV